MTKNDLKTGMLVEFNSGKTALVLKDSFNTLYYGNINTILSTFEGFMILDNYSQDLINGYLSNNWTINKVYDNNSRTDPNNMLSLSSKGRKLLWERKPIETIEIAGQKYNKKEFENAVKDLKPIKFIIIYLMLKKN